MACADCAASIPPIPVPCAMVEMLETPIFRSRRAVSPDTDRTASASKSDDFPSPTTTTRAGAIFPSVWMIVTSPRLPVISPSSMRLVIAPSSAPSTAPVAPPGRVTPSNKLTIIASVSRTLMSPAATSNFMPALLIHVSGNWVEQIISDSLHNVPPPPRPTPSPVLRRNLGESDLSPLPSLADRGRHLTIAPLSIDEKKPALSF